MPIGLGPAGHVEPGDTSHDGRIVLMLDANPLLQRGAGEVGDIACGKNVGSAGPKQLIDDDPVAHIQARAPGRRKYMTEGSLPLSRRGDPPDVGITPWLDEAVPSRGADFVEAPLRHNVMVPEQAAIQCVGRRNLIGPVGGIDDMVDEPIDCLVGDADRIAGAGRRCRAGAQ